MSRLHSVLRIIISKQIVEDICGVQLLAFQVDAKKGRLYDSRPTLSTEVRISNLKCNLNEKPYFILAQTGFGFSLSLN